MAQTTVRNLKKSMNESYQSKYLVTGRIIYFYKKNPSGYFPQVLRKTYHPATRYSRFLRNFIPINQTIWNHAPEFIQPIESFYCSLF